MAPTDGRRFRLRLGRTESPTWISESRTVELCRSSWLGRGVAMLTWRSGGKDRACCCSLIDALRGERGLAGCPSTPSQQGEGARRYSEYFRPRRYFRISPDAAAEVLSEGRPPCHQPASRYELLYASEGERAQPPASVQRRSEQAAAPAALTQHARCSNAHHRYYRVHVWATDSRHFHHPHLHITASLSRSSLMLSACPQQSARPCRPLVVHEEVRVLPSLLT